MRSQSIIARFTLIVVWFGASPSQFVRLSGRALYKALMITASLCCTGLVMIVIVAKDRLSELTSREGDWFLDELCSMSGNVNQLLLLLKDHPMVREEVQKPKRTL